ncbi:hypothetical protein [Cedecea sp. NFIX57]|uniref:hypothetical protein n=1 Tax=Cedecea sp. NFIX57 TaxID=1566286 RepID=UPI000A0E1E1F|nr:hypothetical protein [Cedecea sp. NFIX57]SMG60645.1 hypothetical protein SAMN03159353_103820 [Cedecea sp. NFIX57]
MHNLIFVLSVPGFCIFGLIVALVYLRYQLRRVQHELDEMIIAKKTIEHNYDVLIDELMEPSGGIMGGVNSIRNLTQYFYSLPDNPAKSAAQKEIHYIENQLNQLLLRAIGRKGVSAEYGNYRG